MRGCGSRKTGGIYLTVDVAPGGKPFWTFLVDPPVRFTGERFRGVRVAPPEMTVGWDDDTVLLIDMVGVEHYPFPSDFAEEVRRMGLSRRVQNAFDFASLKDKRVFLGLLHWRVPARLDQPRTWEYRWGVHAHDNCVFDAWLTPPHENGVITLTHKGVPLFSYSRYGPVTADSVDRVPIEPLAAEYAPALFMIFEIKDVDVICAYDADGLHAPETQVAQSGLNVRYCTS